MSGVLGVRVRFVMVVLLIVGMALSLLFARALWRSDILNSTEVEASRTIDRVNAARFYYGKVGAQRAHDGGLRILHDYQNTRTALPFPATFVHEMAHIFSAPKDISVQFYSPLPFTGRQPHQFDSFQAEAWQYLAESTKDKYVSLEHVGGRDWLRFVRADRLVKQYCVDCHNAHPASQKTDWKLGDLRGLIEVSIDIDDRLSGVDRTLFSIAMAAIALIIGAALLAARLDKKMAAGGALAAVGAGAAASEYDGSNLPATRQEEAAFSLAAPPQDDAFTQAREEIEEIEEEFASEVDDLGEDADFMHEEQPEPPDQPREK